MNYKVIVILAKTRQKDGFCIAGRELYLERKSHCLGAWVRLVSADKLSKGAILPMQCELNNQQEAEVLDVVLVPIKKNLPLPAQPDNLLIEECDSWVIKGRIPAAIMMAFIEKPDYIWYASAKPNYILPGEVKYESEVKQSLYIIQVKQLTFVLSFAYNYFTQRYERKMTAKFIYNEELYEKFPVLDPKVRRMLANQYPEKGAKSKQLTLLKKDNYYLCVGLGAAWGKYKQHYKMVMTVFDFDGYLQNHYA